jgi:hypothetical protein
LRLFSSVSRCFWSKRSRFHRIACCARTSMKVRDAAGLHPPCFWLGNAESAICRENVPRGAAQASLRPHRDIRRNRAEGTARPETTVSPNRNPRLRLPRWQQGTSCHDASASSPLDDFLRQTSAAAGPGTRTLRRYRHDLGLEVRNDRYSVLRSRGGVRGEGADAQLRRR